jgi:signal transduction histidine kinase/DNA-binding response OmpR family regulator
MKLKFWFSLCFLILLESTASAQHVDESFQIAYEVLANNDIDSAEKIISNLKSSLSDSDLENYHNQAAAFYATIGNFEKEIAHLMQQIEYSNASQDSIYYIKQKLGVAHLNAGDLNASLHIFENCAEYFSRHLDASRLARSYNGMASVLGHQSNGESAIVYFTMAIKIYEQLNMPVELSYTYSNLAVLYAEMGDANKALKLRKIAHNLVLDSGSEQDVHYCELDLGSSYNNIGEYEKAIAVLQKARTYFELHFNAQVLNGIYNELGRAYAELGNNGKAAEYYVLSISLLKNGGFDFALPGTIANYGNVLIRLGKSNEAVQICSEVLPMAKEMGYLDVEIVICDCLYSGYKGVGNADSALVYFEYLMALKDSVSSTEVQKSVLEKELSTTHSIEKKSILLSAESALNEEVNARKIWIIGAFVLVAAMVILFLAFRQKKRSEEAIKIEKEYLDNLLHNLVHEFRTPLTLIKGPTEELLKKDGNNRLLQLVDKNSDRMLMLVNQVLDFAKIKAGRLTVIDETMNLSVFFHDISMLFEPLAKEKQIQLLNQVNKIDSFVKIDSDKLFKIVSNLISNAIKYSDQNGIVTLQAKVNAKTLIVTIQDTGCGISEANQEHVFKKFYQVDATITRKAEGTGLGLAFVKELVTLMQGEICLESKVGVGTKVTVSLPIQVLDKVVPPPEKESQPTFENEGSASQILKRISEDEDKKMILVIEDNRDLQSFLQQLLQDHGYDVHIAVDGLAGVEKAEELIPDLVISDVMMPKMDGLQVVQKLKSTFATDHIPIIMLTAKVSFDSMVDGLSVGADDYLSKPFKSQELLLRVANLIKRQEKLRAKYQEQDKDEPLKTSVKDPLIQKIEALILSDVSVQPTVDDLAQACALSRSQLHRKIKFITGLSTTALLTDIRLTQSKIDLKTTQLSISEIAYKFGYSDPAHYSKLFKKQFNETPSDYRSSFK